MGCNCKTAKKLDERLNANNQVIEKKGTLKILGMLGNSVIKIFNGILLTIFIIVLVPIVMLTLLFNLIVKESPSVPLPIKFLSKKNKNHEKLDEFIDNKIAEMENLSDNKD